MNTVSINFEHRKKVNSILLLCLLLFMFVLSITLYNNHNKQLQHETKYGYSIILNNFKNEINI